MVVLTPSRWRYHDPILQECGTATSAITVSSLVVEITNDLLVVGALAHFTSPCELGFEITRGSDH